MEQWEKIIESEIQFYLNVQEYENDLLNRYYESQVIHVPVTTYDEDLGRVYLSCPTTEEQVISRMESKAAIENLLRRAAGRINRLNRALAQLTPEELDVISVYYFEGFTSELRMARTLGFKTVKDFIREKDRVLKKVFECYQEERDMALVDAKIAADEELKRKARQWNESRYGG